MLLVKGSFNAFDKKVHVQHFLITHLFAFRGYNFPFSIFQGAPEYIPLAAYNFFSLGIYQVANILGNHRAHFGKFYYVRINSAPELVGFPLAVHGFSHYTGIVGTKVPNGACQNGISHKLTHVRIITDTHFAALFSCFLWFGGILVLRDYIGTAVQQGNCSFTLFDRIVPGVGPYNFYGCIGINFLYTQGKPIYTADNFGNREGGHITDNIGFGGITGNQSGEVTRLIHTAEVGRHVFVGFITGTVLEVYIRELLGNFQHWIHISEGGSKNHIVTLLGILTHNSGSVGTLRYIFNIGCLNCIAKLFNHIFPTTIMLVGPS